MSRARSWGGRALQILLLAVIAWFVYRSLAPELDQLTLRDLSKASVPLLLLSTLLLLAMYIMHALLWRHIAQQLSGGRLSLRDTIHIYFVSGLGRYLPGKLWQIAGMALMAQRAGLSPVVATAASLIGQLAFLTMGLVLLAVLLPVRYGGAAILAALGLVTFAIAIFLLGNTTQGRSLRQRVLARFGPRMAEAGALLDRVTPGRAARWAFAYGMSWALLGAAFSVFAIAFDPAFAPHARHFAGTVAASYLVGLLSFMPGGLGFRELSMVALLSTVVPGPAALLIAVTSRVWFTIAEMAPIALIPLLPGTPEDLAAA